MRFKNEVMYYLKIGELWVWEVRTEGYFVSKSMTYGWNNEKDAVDAAKIVAKLSDRDVLLLKLEVIRTIEAD